MLLLPLAAPRNHATPCLHRAPRHLPQLIKHGFSARVGIFSGPVDRVVPHAKTGRADYFGQPVNRAARLMATAHGSQVRLPPAMRAA